MTGKFGTKGVEVKSSASKYIEPGNQTLQIVDISLKIAASTGSKQVIFHMEGTPLENFEGVDGAKGQVGRVSSSTYLKDDAAVANWINSSLIKVAIALDMRKELDAVTANTFEEYIAAIKPILTNKFAKWVISGEEYVKPNGRIGVRLLLPRYDFVGDLSNTIKVATFSKANKYHYKAAEPVSSGLPVDFQVDEAPF